ncbi:hypothetical protein ACO0RG_001105 [Hanseniaspora osmophila]|uniref:Meiosis-specific transcription factor NDT80 n=1 Tax=Hanseniaspora osmophila TaxID=56408 RepID=A0A1E5RNW5_9ASCO|nr:Meiosis-specific transcription factor NDT80 [Hanseniaspora osmophila]
MAKKSGKKVNNNQNLANNEKLDNTAKRPNSQGRVPPRSFLLYKAGPVFANATKYHQIVTAQSHTKVNVEIMSRIDRGFDFEEGSWTGYKRNYFSLVAGFEVSNIESGTFLDENYCVEINGSFLPVEYFATKITAGAIVENVEMPLVQHTAKRTNGIQSAPQIQAVIPSSLPSPQIIRETSNIRSSAKVEKYASELYLDKSISAELLEKKESIISNYPKGNIQKFAKYERIQFRSSDQIKKNAQFNNFFTLFSILGVVIKGNVVSLAEQENGVVQPVYMEHDNCTFVPITSKATPPLMVRGRTPSSYHPKKIKALKQKKKEVNELLKTLKANPSGLHGMTTEKKNHDFDAMATSQKEFVASKKAKSKTVKDQQESDSTLKSSRKTNTMQKRKPLGMVQKKQPSRQVDGKIISSFEQMLQHTNTGETNDQSVGGLLKKNEALNQKEDPRNGGKLEQTESEGDLSLMKDESFLESNMPSDRPEAGLSSGRKVNLPVCATLSNTTKRVFVRRTRRAESEFYQNVFANDGFERKLRSARDVPSFTVQSVPSTGSRSFKQTFGDEFNGNEISVGEITQDSFTSPVKKINKVHKSVFGADEVSVESEGFENKSLEWNAFEKVEGSVFENHNAPLILLNGTKQTCTQNTEGSGMGRTQHTNLFKGTKFFANNFGKKLENRKNQEGNHSFQTQPVESNWRSLEPYKGSFDGMLPVSSSYSRVSSSISGFSSSRLYNDIKFQDVAESFLACKFNKGAPRSETSYKSSNITTNNEMENKEARKESDEHILNN